MGAYARKFGFGTETGDCLGIDYFIGPDGEVVVTEIIRQVRPGQTRTRSTSRGNASASASPPANTPSAPVLRHQSAQSSHPPMKQNLEIQLIPYLY